MSNFENSCENMQFANKRSVKQYDEDSKYATKRGLIDIQNAQNKKTKLIDFDIDTFESMIKDIYDEQHSSKCFAFGEHPRSAEYWELHHKFANVITATFTYIKYRKNEIDNLNWPRKGQVRHSPR